MARHPHPTYLKVLRGNPGHRPLPEREPEPTQSDAVPEPPPWIEGEGAAEWRRVAPELHRLRLVTPVDLSVLEAYCLAYGHWRDAEEALARMRKNDPLVRGLWIKVGKDGPPIENPLIRTSRRCAGTFLQAAMLLGISSLARARLAGVGIGPSGDKPSRFGGLLA
jgi:P27 family predicted phage terminase small subunit